VRRRIASNPALSVAVLAIGLGVGFEFVRAFTGVGGSALDSLTGTWVYTAVEWIAVAVCVARALVRRTDRLAWALMAFGLLAWAVGDLIWTVWLDYLANPPFPSAADAAYLLMYPSVYGALMLLIRSRLRHVGLAQWLDGGVVGLTVASFAAALVFATVVATSGGQFTAELVNVAYPVGDFILLVFVAGAFSLAGWRPGPVWILLGAGVVTSAVADIVYVYLVAQGTYDDGTLLNSTYLLSFSLMALSAWVPERRRVAAAAVEAPHTIILTMLAACCALALLVTAAFTKLSWLAVALAAGALVLACVRAALTYLENVRMLRASAREAVTDALSGLGNRRALMQDLEPACGHLGDARPATLVFFDLNGFKRYNDSFGHAAGDALLARIGASLRDAIGGRGTAYRLGGDEFCALLEGRHAAADPLIASLADALVERGSAFTVDTTFGVAIVPDDAPTAQAAVQLADERMYLQKTHDSRAQARDVLMQLLNERTPGLLAHVSGVTDLVRAVAAELALGGEELDELIRAAELHDIGKLAIPDEIINKPSALDPEEWRFMRQHSEIGERILGAAPALLAVANLVRASHERWDGSGYPDGLAGEEIPLGARIVAACDAFDAMTSERCYQPARSRAEAIAELRGNAGSQFDPRVVEALCRVLEPVAARPAPAVAARLAGPPRPARGTAA
jgi:diguanylate cyclase (GGDEF)-like protein